jgi:signal transduction histidine kinase
VGGRIFGLEEGLAQAPVPFIVLRGSDLVVETANEASIAAARVGRDLVGQPLLNNFPELADQPIPELLRGVMRSGVPFTDRELLIRLESDGALRDTHWNVIWTPLDRAPGDARVACIYVDVTTQVEARLKLEALTAQLESASRSKDEFLAMLGHELRNPLSPILTALELMRLRGLRSREQDIIERQVSHITRLVDDLLDVSRIARGKVVLRLQRVEVADVVSRAIETVGPLLERRAHRLEVDVPRNGLVVDADVDRLGQVFVNLLTNAAKYSEVASRIVLTARAAAGRVRLRFRDHGIGIAPDMIGRIFDPFIQEGQSIERSRGGLGLGLTIATSLVNLHGGSLVAHSEGVGRGSELVVDLPLAAAIPIESGERLVAAHAPRLRKRILVVDDNEDATMMLKFAFEELGYDVEVAPDGPTALGLARTFRPDVALLDIGLPVMDGYELAERMMAELPAEARPRLVAVTGYGQDADVRRSRGIGFEEHLVKPVDLRKLEHVVKRLVS